MSNCARPSTLPISNDPAISNARLENGLTLWHEHRPGTGAVSLGISIPVGSRHEPARLRGISHLLEHMLFNGTRQLSEARLQAELERRGGNSGGFTEAELTAYLLTLPASEVEFGLEYLHQIVFEPTLPAHLLEREKRIIVNESQDHRSRALWRIHGWLLTHGLLPAQLLDAPPRLLFDTPDLREPVIGFPDTRSRITMDDLRCHYEQHYTPSRATLIAVGDVEPAHLHALVARRFDGVPTRPHSDPRPVSIPTLNIAGQRRVSRLVSAKSDLHLTFHFPFRGAQDDGRVAIHLLGFHLRDLVQDRLRRQLGWVYHVRLNLPLHTDCGAVGIAVTIDHRHLRRAEKEIATILDRLSAGQFDAEMLDRTVRSATGSWAVAMQSNAAYLEWLLSQPELALGRFPPCVGAQFDIVTEDGLKRVAARLLAPRNCFVMANQPSAVVTLLLEIAFFAVCFLLALFIAGGLQLAYILVRRWLGLL